MDAARQVISTASGFLIGEAFIRIFASPSRRTFTRSPPGLPERDIDGAGVLSLAECTVLIGSERSIFTDFLDLR